MVSGLSYASEGVDEIVKLSQAGVHEAVLTLKVEQSDVAFDLNADEIVRLNDSGVPPKVIIAMIVRGKKLQKQAAAAKLEPEPASNPLRKPEPGPAPAPEARTPAPEHAVNSYTVQALKKSEIQGHKAYAPDGKKFFVNKEDEKGVGQIYIGTNGNSALTCIFSIWKMGAY